MAKIQFHFDRFSGVRADHIGWRLRSLFRDKEEIACVDFRQGNFRLFEFLISQAAIGHSTSLDSSDQRIQLGQARTAQNQDQLLGPGGIDKQPACLGAWMIPPDISRVKQLLQD